jgi:hypothetical protein
MHVPSASGHHDVIIIQAARARQACPPAATTVRATLSRAADAPLDQHDRQPITREASMALQNSSTRTELEMFA